MASTASGLLSNSLLASTVSSLLATWTSTVSGLLVQPGPFALSSYIQVRLPLLGEVPHGGDDSFTKLLVCLC
jgi:hypothetical protein